MKLQEFFKQARKDYLSVTPPERVRLYGWLELQDKLNKKFSVREAFVWFMVRPAVAATLAVLVLLVGTASIFVSAKGSLPGETLYPVKRLYEDVASAVSGNEQIKIEGRAQEIIVLSQKEEEDTQKIKEAVVEYEMTVAKVEKKVEEGQTEEFKEQLEKNRKEFEQIYSKSKSKEEIKRAIEATQKWMNVKGINKRPSWPFPVPQRQFPDK